MMHSRGELLLMLDADGATKVTDLEKLENQVCLSFCSWNFRQSGNCVLQMSWSPIASQIHAVAREESSIRDPALKHVDFRIGDVQVSAFGSRAHLEEKALATVKFCKVLDTVS